MAILSVIPGNPLLWTFLMENFKLGIVKMTVTSENPLFLNTVLPKTSVQSSPDLTNSVLTNHPGLTNWFLPQISLHKKFGFNEYPGLMNNWLGPERFVKSGDHCISYFKKLSPKPFKAALTGVVGPQTAIFYCIKGC